MYSIKIKKVGIIFSFLIVGLIISGCKKEKISSPLIENPKNDKVEQFLQLPANSDPKLVRIVHELQQREVKYHFLNKVILECGLPKWEFSEFETSPTLAQSIIQTNAVGKNGNTTQTNNDTTIIIPLVLDSTKYVNSYIVAKLSDSVQLQLVKGKDYSKYGYDKKDNFTAQTVALRCIKFDNKIFSKDSFYVYDDKLAQMFSNKNNVFRVKILINNPSASTSAVKTSSISQETCVYFNAEISYTVCIAPGHCYGFLGTCDGCPDCTQKATVPQSYCYTSSSSMFSDDMGSGGYVGGSNDGTGSTENYYDVGWTSLGASSDIIADENDISIGLDVDNSYYGYDADANEQTDLNQPISTINDIMGIRNFVKRRTSSENCLEISKAQILKLNYYVNGWMPGSQTYQTYRRDNGINKSRAESGVKYMVDALKKGQPVVIGVDYGKTSGNDDHTTNHFVVVVGMGRNSQGLIYFRFYDNYTANTKYGTHPSNIVTYDPNTGSLTGFFVGVPDQGIAPIFYKVSQIRQTFKTK